jgi:hypothetical protein
MTFEAQGLLAFGSGNTGSNTFEAQGLLAFGSGNTGSNSAKAAIRSQHAATDERKERGRRGAHSFMHTS